MPDYLSLHFDLNMSDPKNLLNSIGLVLSMIGVYVVYRFSPLNTAEIDGGDFDSDMQKEKLETARKNAWMRIGIYIVIFGTLLQLISNFMPMSPDVAVHQ